MGVTWRGAYDGNPFLGLYARASDKLALIPRGAHPKFVKGAEEALKVPLVKASVDGCPYVGVYFAFNSRGIIAPPFVNKQELKELQATGLEVTVLPDSRYCAVGNNVCCNDNGALVHPDMPPALVKLVEKGLGVKALQMMIGGYKTVGAACVATNKGWLGHNRMTDEEAGALDELFGVKGSNGSVNSGTALVGLGAVANSNGALCGETTTGYELSKIQQALDLI
ncbi:MAG: translation initiation factor IF-6 [Candidatus Micrarchaeota archaeon]|nr:translation initiation factor IF-6 [Candidatus Micrarchaeota archaeon]